ncbi:uncharacterized protein LOC143299037 isoform X2 [Babylonia areolata]|uniref:uncharacterized protein LOC143299037 isoform X2 n=1 Tax=Babylonia areolata TaxID=304850 RepID=UPI003FD15E37
MSTVRRRFDYPPMGVALDLRNGSAWTLPQDGSLTDTSDRGGGGGGDVSSSAPVSLCSLQQPRASHSVTSPRPISGCSPWRHVANDDSAVYRRSKGGSPGGMRHWRPRRGESFSAGNKSRSPRSHAAADPVCHQTPPSSSTSSSSSYPTTPTTTGIATHPSSSPSSHASSQPAASAVRPEHHAGFTAGHYPSPDRDRARPAADRDPGRGRQADKDASDSLYGPWSRSWSGRDRDRPPDGEGGEGREPPTQDRATLRSRPRPMVTSTSSPSLSRADPGLAWNDDTTTRWAGPEKPVCRSSSDILDDLLRGDGGRTPSERHGSEGGRSSQFVVNPARGDRIEEGDKVTVHHHHISSTRYAHVSKGVSSDMNVSREAPCSNNNSAAHLHHPHHHPDYHSLPHDHHQHQHHQHHLHHHQPPSVSQSASSKHQQPDHHPGPNYHQPDHHTAAANCRPDHNNQSVVASSQNAGSGGVGAGSHTRERDSQCVAVRSVKAPPAFQPYENVTLLASASLKKEKNSNVSPCSGEETGGRGGAGDVGDPSLLSRPYSGGGSDCVGPAPPLQDSSSLRFNKVNQSHPQDPCPAWPSSSPASTSTTTSSRDTARAAPSSSDQLHHHTQQEVCPPQLRLPPDSRPGETTPATATHGKGGQRSPQDNMKARLENLGLNSLPGYLPPRVDSGGGGGGGGSLGDKDHSARTAPERGVDSASRQRFSPGGTTSTPQSAQPHPHPHRSAPGSLPIVSSLGDSSKRVDKSTSPLASPHNSLPSPGDTPSPTSRSPSPRNVLHRDSAVAAIRQPSKTAGKATVVRSTPYYNTSTQTEVSAYALKTSDPRGVPQCSVQIQVDEAEGQQPLAPPRRAALEEKSIQARMSRDLQRPDLETSSGQVRKAPELLQPSHLDQTGVRKSPPEEKAFFQHPFEGMKSIQQKYGLDVEEGPGSREEGAMFSCAARGEQASIMRQLSEEFYRGNRLGVGVGDKLHLSAPHLEPAFRSLDGSGLAVGGEDPYSNMALRPTHGAGVFGRQLSGSQTSTADPHHSPTSPWSQSSIRGPGPGCHRGQEGFPWSSPRPLQEAKKFKSLSAISHRREASVPVMGSSLAQSHESLSPDAVSVNGSKRHPPAESGRDSCSVPKSPSPTSPHSSSESSGVGGHRQHNFGACRSSSGSLSTGVVARHTRTQSVDSLLSDRAAGGPKDRGPRAGNADRTAMDSSSLKKANTDIGRKPSMKKAYGIYDDSDVHVAAKDHRTSTDPAERGKGVSSDSLPLGQIREEGDSVFLSTSKPQRSGEFTRGRPQGEAPDPRHGLDSWRDDLDRRTGRFHSRSTSELIPFSRDHALKGLETPPSSSSSYSYSSHRPPRLFDGSIDSGVGSEISCRADGMATPSETPRSPFLPLDNPTGAELKQIQQQAVISFLQRKTGKSFHSPEPSLYEPATSAASTPRVAPQPKATADPVADLISKTNANLAKRADSLRRSSSICSRSSSADHVEVSRSRKETEWSRLRSSGSFNYGSNRSSVCSDNTYEDISVFGPSTPRGSVQEAEKGGRDQTTVKQILPGHSGGQRSNTDSGVMASTTAYQNIPGPPPRRRPPPPPPRSPSPEPGPPPALPPRNYGPRKEEGTQKSEPSGGGEGSKVDESRVDFKAVLQQCRDRLSPRDDAYTAQLRKLDVKFSGMRGSTSSSSSASITTPPSSVSVLHSRTPPTGLSTSYKRQPMTAQEATPPVCSSSATISLVPAVSSPSSSSPSACSVDTGLGGAMPASSAFAQQHHHISDFSSVVETRVSASLSSSHTKEVRSEPPVSVVVDRDTKPVTTSPSSAKPPQLPERAAPVPPREQKPPPPRPEQQLPPPRGEPPLPRDRGVADFLAKVSEWQILPPPEVPRDRKLVDSHAHDSGSVSPLKDSSRSPAGKRRDVPPPPLSPADRDAHDGVGLVVDPSHLPPPPPELLNESGGPFAPGEQEKLDPFADDSYGAYRNRGSRQVGTYKRSSSAALIRPENQHLQASDAQAVFGDRRLGNQAWNSDSQLQANRKAEVQQGGAPQRPPDRAAGNLPADGGPARSGGRVSGVCQLPASSGQSVGRGRDEGKVFTAHPFRVEQPREKEVMNSYDTAPSSRLVKDHAEKTVSPTTSSSPMSSATSPLHSTGTPTSSGQRRANTSQRGVGDDMKAPPVTAGSSGHHAHRVSNARPAVLPTTDCQQPGDRPPVSSPTGSTHSGPAHRSRVLSDRSWSGDVSPSSDSRQRYAEVAPFASDPRGLPGHVRNFAPNSDPPRSAPSPYSRRESAPASHIPPEAIAKVPPRRKSEEQLLTDVDKDSGVPAEQVLISHGRQPSQEELECDQRAKELAKEVADREKKLSDVLNTDTSKRRIDYLNGLFSEPVKADVKIQSSVRRHQSQGAGDALSSKSPKFSGDEDPLKKRTTAPLKHWVSSPGMAVDGEKQEPPPPSPSRNTLDNDTLVKHKEEVMEKLHKKLELLKEERKGLQGEIDDNKALGKRICDTVDSKCSNPSERDKFHTYVNDVEKIVRLLLNLSGQLARAENSVKAMEEDADPEQKKRALEKCEGLRTKHAEATQLKQHIDKRSDNVMAILRQWLSREELRDYGHFITSTSRLTIHLQQLEDEINTSQQQIAELKNSMAEHASNTKTSPSPTASSVPVLS